MLAFIRKALSSWIVLALLGLLLVAFIITGVNDPFGGGPRAGTVATVGGEEISEPEFATQFDRFLRRVRQENPQATAQAFAQAGGVDRVLQELIGAKALEIFGEREGIAVSDRAIDAEIASFPAFQVNGKFDQATYERVLTEQRLSQRELREGLHGDLIRRQLVLPVAAGVETPRELITPYAALLLEQRRGTIAIVPSASIKGVPTPTEAQVQAFYEKNKQGFTIPERRAFRYALLSKEQLASRVSVTDADVKRYYDEHRDVYAGHEERELSQVVVQDQATAQKIVQRAQAGEPFAKVAADLAGYAPEDLAVGRQKREQFAEATSPAVAAAAFTTQQGSVSAPVQSDFGWHVVRVDRVIPGQPRTLEQARGEIVAALRDEQTENVLADTVAKIEDALAEGQSLADVAKENGLQLVTVPAVTREGQTTGQVADKLEPRATPLVARAFDVDSGADPTVEELSEDLYAVLEVTEVVPPTAIPLAQIKPAVAAQWQREQQQQRAKAMADEIVAEVSKGTPLATALSKRGLPAPRPFAGRRIDISRQQQVPPPVAMLFSLPNGTTRTLAAPGNQGMFIVKVDGVTQGDPNADPMMLASMQQQIAQVAADELAGQFTRAVEARVGVKRNESVVKAMRDRYLGGATEQP